ncbi:MAG: LPXTG cell wall anchor domain-containing protein [Lachnospiraceae bacterium]|nr:LPXTG cell wall anchor domain-containing protein [Lachnospiraceae bacterium]
MKLKNILKSLLTVVLAVSMISTEASAITGESLSNKESDTGTQVHKVDNSANTGLFKVLMSDSSDEMTVYQIATMDLTNGTVSWIPEVQNWIGVSAGGATTNASADGKAFAAYYKPELLASASTAVQTDFYNALYGKINGTAGIDFANCPVSVETSETNINSGKVVKASSQDQIAFYLKNPTDTFLVIADKTYVPRQGYQNGANGGTIYIAGEEVTYQVVDENGSTTQSLVLTDSNYATAGLIPVTYFILHDAVDVPSARIAEGSIYQEAALGSYTFNDMPIGLYAVVANSGSKIYSPLTVALIPNRDGATGAWYLSDEISVSLKAAELTMEKTINGKKSDIVHVGEDVQFEITFNIPEYTERRVENTQTGKYEFRNSIKKYTLTFDDVLDSAFTLDADSVTVKYRNDSSDAWEEFPEKYYNSLIASPAASENDYGVYVGGCSPSHMYLYKIFINNYKHYDGVTSATAGATYDPDKDKYYVMGHAYYYERDGAYYLMENDTAQNMPAYYGNSSTTYVPVTPGTTVLTGNQIRALYSSYTKDTIGHGWKLFPASQYPEYALNIFNVSFNYDVMLDDNFDLSNLELQIRYNAEVNKTIDMGSEDNTNYVKMTYETNSQGTTTDVIDDEVRAYSYGVNVVKIDGDTADSASPTYLAGAVFQLYREIGSFTGTDDTATFDALYDGGTSYTVGENTIDLTVGTSTADDLIQFLNTNNVQTYTAEVNGEYKVFGLQTLSDRTYGTSFNGTITSVANANGVNVNGLDVGNYVLVETNPPSSEYNVLAEDIYFEINPLTEEVANSNYNGSYAGFMTAGGNDATYMATGYYKMNVLNYKGLTLPSTGGIGTKIFTVSGLLLMMIAMVVILMKSRRKATTTLMGLAFAVALILGSSMGSAKAATPIAIGNNQYGTEVTGNGTTTFTVELNLPGDRIKVYQLAELRYENGTFTSPTWSTAFGEDVRTSEFSAYSTPELLGAADPSVQVRFLEWANTWCSQRAALQGMDFSGVEFTSLSQDGLYYTVRNVPYGIYLIKADNTSGKNYTPLTVNAMPTQEGPTGKWFLNENINATLKFSSITIDKTINGNDVYDTVHAGENVEFAIVAEVPKYPGITPKYDLTDPSNPVVVKDLSGNTVYDYSGYTYAITDIMDRNDGFELVGNFTVEYATDGPENWITLPTTDYTLLFANAAESNASTGLFTYYDASNSNNVMFLDVEVSESNSSTYVYKYYSLDPDSQNVTLLYETTSVAINVPATVTNTTVLQNYKEAMGIDVASFTRANASSWQTVYNVSFDYEALYELNALYVRITYDATADGTTVAANVAKATYQSGIDGSYSDIEDTVYAYSYILNLVKSDGDNAGTYLAGAIFNLYKEAYTFAPDLATRDASATADYQYFTWKKANLDDSVTTAPTGYETMAAVDALTGQDFYYRVIAVEASDTPCELDDLTAAHSHIVVYNVLQSNITSNNTANGVNVNGLEPASYILIETAAPEGYNRLNEAIRFEITELTAEGSLLFEGDENNKEDFMADEIVEITAPRVTDSSAAGYADYIAELTAKRAAYNPADGKHHLVYTDSVYPVDVKNYRGLTLPSTGGIGTKIFTVAGIAVMLLAILIIVMKNRKNKEDEQY